MVCQYSDVAFGRLRARTDQHDNMPSKDVQLLPPCSRSLACNTAVLPNKSPQRLLRLFADVRRTRLIAIEMVEEYVQECGGRLFRPVGLKNGAGGHHHSS